MKTHQKKHFFSQSASAVLSVALALLLFLPVDGMAQDEEHIPPRPELRKWSLQVFGGTYISRTGSGLTPFTGSTGVKSGWINPAAGLGIEYMMTPALALNLRYTYGVVTNDDDLLSYKNTYQSVSGGVSLYIFNIATLDRSHSWFNPYVSFLVGIGQSDWTDLEGLPDWDSRYGHYGIGLGTRVRLGGSVDLSLDYTYQLFNPDLHFDGHRRVRGMHTSDRLAGFTAGLVFNMGSSRRPHSRWYSTEPATQQWRGSVDAALAEREGEFDRILADLERHQERLDQLNRELQDKAPRSDLEQARRTIAMLEEQLADMESRHDGDIERIDHIHEAAGIAHLRSTLEPGIYIQTYASRGVRFSHRALEMTRDGLAQRGYDTDRLSFTVYQLPNGLYTVQVGNISSFDEANDVLTGVLDVFDDAFVRQHQTGQ